MKKLRELISLTHKHGLEIAAKIKGLQLMKRGLERINRKRWQEVKAQTPKPKPSLNVTMYDSTDVGTVPPNPEAVAGYIGGAWQTYKPLVQKFPRAHHLSIAIAASEDAECLDIENGDATPDEAPAWVRRQHSRGIGRPVVYASLSAMPEVLAKLAADSTPRRLVRVWTAHYTYKPHLCNVHCGFGFTGVADATQYTDKAFNRNLDASLCWSTFFQTGGH